MVTQEQSDSFAAYIWFTGTYIITALLCGYISPRKAVHISKVAKVLLRNFSILLAISLVVPFLPITQWKLGPVASILLSAVVVEFWFYYSHRIMHWKWIYRRFHKQHHEFIEPYGWT